MKAIRLWLLMLSTLLVLATGLPAYGQSLLGNNSDFLPVDQAFEYSLKDNNDGTVTLLWDIAPGYYLYRGRMTVEGNNTGLDDVAFPPGYTITDEFFGDSEVYFNQAELLITTGDATALSLTWQGCAEAGLCYPPQSVNVDFSGQEVQAKDISRSGSTGDMRSSVSSDEQAEDQSLASQLADSGLLWNLAIFFGLGLLLVFTPCVLPMIPILSAVIVGSEAGRGRAFLISLVFVIAMAITYALLGVAAALAGAQPAGHPANTSVYSPSGSRFRIASTIHVRALRVATTRVCSRPPGQSEQPAKRRKPNRCSGHGFSLRPSGQPLHDCPPCRGTYLHSG